MLLYKQIIGVVAVIITFASYVPYIIDILKGKTKPHSFSWLVWSILVWVGFAAQISDSAGPGAYVNFFTGLICIFIFFFGLKYRSNIVVSDYISLFFALATIPVWMVTANPVYSVILVTAIDIVAFIPTIRKTYLNPETETMSTYILNSVKHFLALTAMTNYTLTTSLYTAYLVFVNAGFAVMLYARRKSIHGSVRKRSGHG